MKVDEIRNEVTRIIADQSYDPDVITGYINQTLNFTVGVVDIPELKKVFTVTTATDVAYVSLADQIDNYGGRVRMVKYDGVALHVYSSIEDMLIDYDDLETAGDIECCAMEGRNLWYAYIPETAVSLLVVCYENPEPLSRDNKVPEWMPEHLHYKILVNGAASMVWRQMEEEDSNQPMTRLYEGLFREGITDLRCYIAKNRKSVSYSMWRY